MKNRRIASIFKDIPKVTYIVANSLKKSSNILIPDGFDGWNAVAFANNGHEVSLYEPDVLFIDGGKLNHGSEVIKGSVLKERINAYQLDKKISYHNTNYYSEKTKQKFDVVYVYNSWHREINASMPLAKKVEVLKKSVATNGILYICYHLAQDDNDYEKYPANLYPRDNELLSYFDLSEWQVIFKKERNVLREAQGAMLTSNRLRIGYLHLKK